MRSKNWMEIILAASVLTAALGLVVLTVKALSYSNEVVEFLNNGIVILGEK